MTPSKGPGTSLARGRVPALDGLRGLALLAVLGYHAAPGMVRGGFLGVEMFFVLSGFLLTALLLDEHRRTGAIDRGAYAVRRIRRIAPALLVLLAVVVTSVRALVPGDAHRLAGDLWSSLAGLTNWHLVADGSSYFTRFGRPSFVLHLWSVAVEVQAYLLLPFVVVWLARRSRRVGVVVLGGLAGSSALVMGLLYEGGEPSRAYYGTDARIGAVLAGALLALILAGRSADARRKGLPAAVPALVLVGLVLGADPHSRLLYPAGFLAVQAATVALIVTATRGGRAAGVMEGRPLRWLGKRSYGIYLWHWPLVTFLRPGVDVSWHPAVAAAVATAAALLLGSFSYGLVERPFLRRDGWFSRGLPAAMRPALVGTLVALSLVAWSSPPDPIAASLAAGERTLAAQDEAPVPTPPPTAAPVRVEGTAASRAPTPPRAAVRAATAPGPPASPTNPASVAAVGDSVMLGAAPQLKARLGDPSHVDASQSRQFADGVEVVRTLRAEGRIGRVALIHLGSNGTVKPEELDAMMRELDGVPLVLLVTVRVSKPWQDAVNATLHDGAARHPSAAAVDWHAHSDGHPDWFFSDGTHLNARGADGYAGFLAAAVPPPPTPTPSPSPTATPTPTPTPKPKPTPTPKPTPAPTPTPTPAPLPAPLPGPSGDPGA